MTENATTDYALQGNNANQGGSGGGGGVGNALSFDNAKRAASYVGAQATAIGHNIQEGHGSFRLLAFLASLAVIITSILDFLGGVLKINFTHVLLSIVVCIFAIIICILEGREHLPESLRMVQSKIYEQARFLRTIVGRGFFYFFTGLLQFSHWSFLNSISGAFMMFVGLLYVVVGRTTGKKLSEVRASIKDETALQVSFADHDSDNDGFLTQDDFNNMLQSMELQLNTNEQIAAFTAIDENDDGKISFDEFKTWWLSGSETTGAYNLV